MRQITTGMLDDLGFRNTDEFEYTLKTSEKYSIEVSLYADHIHVRINHKNGDEMDTSHCQTLEDLETLIRLFR
jgi:hypothetical protein